MALKSSIVLVFLILSAIYLISINVLLSDGFSRFCTLISLFELRKFGANSQNYEPKAHLEGAQCYICVCHDTFFLDQSEGSKMKSFFGELVPAGTPKNKETYWSEWCVSCTAPPRLRASSPTGWTASRTRSGWCCGASRSPSSSPAAPSRRSRARRTSPECRQT